MVGVTHVHHHRVGVHHLLAEAEVVAVVSVEAGATVSLGLHLEETGISSVLTGQGVLIQAGVLSKAGALNDRKRLLCQGVGNALQHLMRGVQKAEVAPLTGMTDELMVLIMVVAQGRGAEAP